MNEPLKDYIKVGLVHFMAWPECMGGDGPQLETITAIAEDPFFELIELTKINDSYTRMLVLDVLDKSGIELGYGAQPTILGGGLDLNHPVEEERRKAIEATKIAITEAQGMEIRNVALLSGRPDDDKPAAIARLVDSLKELCAHAVTRDCSLILETFDQLAFGKNCLIGPTRDAVEVSWAVREEYPDFGLLLDLSHLPLIGETSKEAIDIAGDHLIHVHIGNCAMDDPEHPAYGDQHPRFGAPGTRNDVAELAEFLRVLLDSEYLNKNDRKAISFEVKPMPGETSEFIVEHSKNALLEAWELV